MTAKKTNTNKMHYECTRKHGMVRMMMDGWNGQFTNGGEYETVEIDENLSGAKIVVRKFNAPGMTPSVRGMFLKDWEANPKNV